jgi:alpha-L-fucosidase
MIKVRGTPTNILANLRAGILPSLLAVASLLAPTSAVDVQAQPSGQQYEPTEQSLRQHSAPEWFQDAKLGIFINWGLYSVPAWAPTSSGPLGEVPPEEWFANNPYAEWYWNTMRIEGSPVQQYHRRTYGEDFSYDDFATAFRDTIQAWDPAVWADLFEEVGARYVVFDTKHHDGFLLWPSRHPNPNKENWQVERDLVGELSTAVRDRDMRFGIYYSGGIDWSFNPVTVTGFADLGKAVPKGAAYAEYATAHWRELIDRYRPVVLWNDIAYPKEAPVMELFSSYYNQVPEGVINDRWSTARELIEGMESGGEATGSVPYDFSTPEYAVYDSITTEKWESTRGLGLSFGYNKNTGEEVMLSVDELVDSFVDIVSKNGNLLLNVGPKADGTIPELQVERLEGFGNWLATNGEALFGTRPWVEAEGQIRGDDAEVRFTKKGDAVYAILLQQPSSRQIVIENVFLGNGAEVHLLGRDEPLSWEQQGRGLAVTLPEQLEDAPAYALKLRPQPWRLLRK